ncbi:MAG: hypothetical protein FXV79_05145 [Candidatus Thioglobus sp.]|nr:MAG: hypothetical protein FXV79_05145 [Candidatus Thioglobus sp.]
MKKILTIIAGLLLIMAIAATYLLDTFGKQYAQGYVQKLLKTPKIYLRDLVFKIQQNENNRFALSFG